MSKSSYEKIYERLIQTKTGKEEVERVRSILNSIEITDYEFTETTRDGKFSFDTYWVLSGNGYNKKFTSLNEINALYGFKSGRIIDTSLIVRNHFGRNGDVKTMNCDRDVILGCKNHDKQNSFNSWFKNEFNDLFTNEIKLLSERAGVKVVAISDSLEFSERKVVFIKHCAITAIRNSLKLYEFLGDEFLQEAIKEYVAHSILES